MRNKSPYSDFGREAFWRSAVADIGVFGMKGIWQSPWQLPADAWFSTFGSCFAQHISRALVARGLNWLNAEKAPDGLSREDKLRFNYGVFSARTGNIYTSRQLLHWVNLAADPELVQTQEIWETQVKGKGVRYQPALCPMIEPDGYDSAPEAYASLLGTARAFRRTITQSDVFVFTLGLTEGWYNRESSAPYAMCPGTIAGSFDQEMHCFENLSYPETRAQLEAAFDMMRGPNPDLRILLTVSPVPLTATASGKHVLPATTYSKSTLRAVAGDLAQALDYVDYFPSFEIIAAPPTRGVFFAPNMRNVEAAGVSLVMDHFFAGLDLAGQPRGAARPDPITDHEGVAASLAEEDLICEEQALEAYDGR